jgi:hypothetical protein
MPGQARKSPQSSGGPYHVNEARTEEIADFIGMSGMKNGGKSRYVPLMFTFSGSMNQRALPKIWGFADAVERRRLERFKATQNLNFGQPPFVVCTQFLYCKRTLDAMTVRILLVTHCLQLRVRPGRFLLFGLLNTSQPSRTSLRNSFVSEK